MSGPTSSASKRRLLLAGRVLAWLIVLASVVFFARGLRWSSMSAAFAAADLRLAILALLLGLPCTVFGGLRWFSLVRPISDASPGTVLAATYVGAAASVLLPMRAGEAVRVELLARATGLPRAVALGTLAIDHTVNGLVMFLFAAVLPLVLPVPLWLALLVWGGVLAAVALVLVMLRLGRPLDADAGSGSARAGILLRLRGGLVGLRNPRAVIPAAIFSAAAWGLEIVVTMVALAAFHLPHDAAHAMGVLFGVNLAQAIPAPPANLGNFELGAAMALVAFGGSNENAAAFALGFHALQLLPTLLGGALALPRFSPSRLPARGFAQERPAEQSPNPATRS